ncbi:MAG: PIN domain-containing protein [Bacteroidota bacterium]
MKIFIDANIIVSVLNNEYPSFTYTSRIVSLADNKRFTVFTSPICLAIAFYFAEKKSGTAMAKKKIQLLSEKLSITSVGKSEVAAALQNKKVNDFEDGLEFYAANSYNCEAIITEDINGFYFSSIPVYNSKSFFEKVLLKGK